MRNSLVIFLLLAFSLFCTAQEKENSLTKEQAQLLLKTALEGKELHNVVNNKTLLLPTATDAIALAELILFRIYGEEKIKEERPYGYIMVNNYWVINGNLPQDTLGGTFLIIIDARNGRVVQITQVNKIMYITSL